MLAGPQPTGIDHIRPCVADVAVEVHVAGDKADRILREESARLRIVVAGAVVVVAGLGVELSARVGEAGDRPGGDIIPLASLMLPIAPKAV